MKKPDPVFYGITLKIKKIDPTAIPPFHTKTQMHTWVCNFAIENFEKVCAELDLSRTWWISDQSPESMMAMMFNYVTRKNPHIKFDSFLSNAGTNGRMSTLRGNVLSDFKRIGMSLKENKNLFPPSTKTSTIVNKLMEFLEFEIDTQATLKKIYIDDKTHPKAYRDCMISIHTAKQNTCTRIMLKIKALIEK